MVPICQAKPVHHFVTVLPLPIWRCSGRPMPPTEFEGMARFKLERELMYPVLAECRVVRL
jgi:hypothetical protein